jgi:hypothetical protein
VAVGEGEKLYWSVVPAVQRWKKTGQIIEKWLYLNKIVVTFYEFSHV